MAKDPQKKMKIMRRTTRITTVLGFGPLNSKASNDLSGIAHLPGYLTLSKVSVKDPQWRDAPFKSSISSF
jgi:hypothetical protein